jgi:CubicO group peptidase (beta-lactamase class C family)
MSTVSRGPTLVIRLLAVLFLLVAGAASMRPVGATPITPRAALVRVLTLTPLQAGWFAPSFLAQASVVQVEQAINGIKSELGPYQSVHDQPDGSYLVQFQAGTAKAQIHLDAQGRIDGLLFTNLKPVPARGTPARAPGDLAAAMDAYLTGLLQTRAFSGSVLVSRHGRVLLARGYGFADLASHLPNTVNTEFRIGSISKQFAAVAILSLQEAGKLSIHDKVCRYFQPCPKAWAPITLQELLTHTSGFPTDATIPGITADLTKPISTAQGIGLIKRIPLDRAPGTGYEYSNYNFDLLGYIIEQITHEPYATYLRQQILNPLLLQQTGYDTNHPDLRIHATGYATWGQPAPYIDLSWVYAAGALYSNVVDLWHWDQALQSDVLLSGATTTDMLAAHASMCAPHTAACEGFDSLAYGYGIVRATLAGHQTIWHNGEINGFTSMNMFFPNDGITIIVLSNLQVANATTIGVHLGQLMLGAS